MCSTLAYLFSKKSVPAKMKKALYTSLIPKNEEIGGNLFLYLAAQNFKLFQKFTINPKNLKPIAVDDVFS